MDVRLYEVGGLFRTKLGVGLALLDNGSDGIGSGY